MIMEIDSEIVGLLRALYREHHRWYRVAQALGTSQRTLERWRDGSRQPSGAAMVLARRLALQGEEGK